MIFVIILLITQMWLLTATLESYLAGHVDVALPGMLVSGILFWLMAVGFVAPAAMRAVEWLRRGGGPEREMFTGARRRRGPRGRGRRESPRWRAVQSASCWYAIDWNDSRCSGETPSFSIAARCSGVE